MSNSETIETLRFMALSFGPVAMDDGLKQTCLDAIAALTQQEAEPVDETPRFDWTPYGMVKIDQGHYVAFADFARPPKPAALPQPVTCAECNGTGKIMLGEADSHHEIVACIRCAEEQPVAGIQKAEMARDAAIGEIERLSVENAKLRATRFARFNNEECWIYTGEGDDHLESLVCPVVIGAAKLLDIINGSSQPVASVPQDVKRFIAANRRYLFVGKEFVHTEDLRTFLSQREAGCVSVPVEPTQEILNAMRQAPSLMTPMPMEVDLTLGGRMCDELRYKAIIAASKEGV